MIRIGLINGGQVVIDGGGITCINLTPQVIGHGLARVSRFGGQTPRPYSVAEHSCLMYDWAKRTGEPPVVLRAILLHDGPECLGVGDVQRFVKREYAESLRAFDRRMNVALWAVLGGNCPWDDVEEKVHWYDSRIGAFEAKAFGFPHEPADLPGANGPYFPEMWPYTWASAEWAQRWEEL